MTGQEEWKSVENWLSRLAASTQATSISIFKRFMLWVEVNGDKFKDFSPDYLVKYQNTCDSFAKYDILDLLVQPYILQYDGTYNTKRLRYSTIRSFFTHNRAELPKDPSFSFGKFKKPVYGDLNPDEIRKTILACNKAYQAAYLVMFQSSMDQEMFIYWNENAYENLVDQLKTEPEVVKIDLPGRKKARNKRRFYTFIGKDAIDALENWFNERPENADAIITNQRGVALKKADLKQYWVRHLRLLGLVPPVKKSKRRNTGKGLHEMRDTFRTLWSKSPADHKVGEFCMGHSIDPLNYDKSFRDVELYKKEYLKAVPFLNIMSSGAAFGRVDVSEVEDLKRKLEEAQNGQNSVQERLAKMEKQQEKLMKMLYERLPRE